MQKDKNQELWIQIHRQVQEMAKELNESAAFVFALFWLGDKAIVPVFRYDLREEDIIAILVSLITQEKRQNDRAVDWHKIFMIVLSYMDSSQLDSFLERFEDSKNWN